MGSCSFNGAIMKERGGSENLITEIKKALRDIRRGAEPVILGMTCAYRIEVKLRDSGETDRFDYTLAKEVKFEKGIIKVIGFDERIKGLAMNVQSIVH